MKRIYPLTTFLLLFSFQLVCGQYYNTGQDPASSKWLQIKTESFTLIYPQSYGQAGIDLATKLETARLRMPDVFHDKQIHIPVVVHSYSNRSNGYVAWAPKRMELYPAPEQNAIPGSQNLLLSLHEFAHVYQMESLNKGFTKAMSFLIGQQMTGAVSSLLPLWYLEGDATLAESVLSDFGRGRNAAFQKPLKALTSTGRTFSYDKMLNGSFRDYVPDHYQYGYQMVSWSKYKYDREIWNKVLDRTGKQPFTIIPVNLELNKNGDITKKRLYYETISTLSQQWNKELNQKQEYIELNPPRKKGYTNYYSPLHVGTGNIIAVKTSLSDPPAIILIDRVTKKEKLLHHPGFMFPYRISEGGGKIVWVENRPDPRWQNRDYSVVILYDLHQGKKKRFGKKTSYMAAAISGDGKMISVIELAPDKKCNLLLLDAETGKITRSVPAPEGNYLQRPDWSADNGLITVINLTEEGEGVLSYSVKENSWITDIEPSRNDLQSALRRNDTLFFVSSAHGTENTFMKVNESIKQITNAQFGSTDPDIYGKEIIFSNYTSRGNSIGSVSVDEDLKETSADEYFIIDQLDKVYNETEYSGKENLYDFKPVPYRKWQHLIRPHSWMPFYADIEKIQSDPLSVRPGLTLLSQNSLSTLEMTAGYEYSENGEHLFHARAIWMGAYPIFESRISYGSIRQLPDQQAYLDNGLNYTGEVSLPLRFSTGWFSQYMRPSITLQYTNSIFNFENRPDNGQTGITWRFYFSNYSRSGLRDIYPSWFQSLDLNYVDYPFDKIFGSTFYTRSAFYFPGLARDNSIRIRLGTEDQRVTNFSFANSIPHPRGYEMILSQKLRTASFDYVFPLAYPDFNISSLLYIKRIRSGFFYDYATGYGNRYYDNNDPGSNVPGKEIFRSYGIELLSDFHVLRIPFMISGGVQAAWKAGSNTPLLNLVFNVDLYGFSIGRQDQTGY